MNQSSFHQVVQSLGVVLLVHRVTQVHGHGSTAIPSNVTPGPKLCRKDDIVSQSCGPDRFGFGPPLGGTGRSLVLDVEEAIALAVTIGVKESIGQDAMMLRIQASVDGLPGGKRLRWKDRL